MLRNIKTGYALLSEGGEDDSKKKNTGLSSFLRNVATKKSGKKYTYRIHDGKYRFYLSNSISIYLMYSKITRDFEFST